MFGVDHPSVVKTKKTRSVILINFQVVSRLDLCSKPQSRRKPYSLHLEQAGTHLGRMECIWNTFGTHLERTWSTFGTHLNCCEERFKA